MAVQALSYTLSTAASIIATGTADYPTFIIKDASATIYLGGSDVTTALGISLAATDALSIQLGPGDVLYAIASAATPTVRVLRTRGNA